MIFTSSFKRFFLAVFASLLLIFAGANAAPHTKTSQTTLKNSALTTAQTPVGYWEQYDDHSGQLESILQVWMYQGKLFGKVIKPFTVAGRPPDVYCTKCTGSLHNTKVIGMTLMWHFSSADNGRWVEGKILDPKTGKLYSCEMTLEPGGQILHVHGYIGFPLLGRTQVWRRTNLATVKHLIATKS